MLILHSPLVYVLLSALGVLGMVSLAVDIASILYFRKVTARSVVASSGFRWTVVRLGLIGVGALPVVYRSLVRDVRLVVTGGPDWQPTGSTFMDIIGILCILAGVTSVGSIIASALDWKAVRTAQVFEEHPLNTQSRLSGGLLMAGLACLFLQVFTFGGCFLETDSGAAGTATAAWAAIILLQTGVLCVAGVGSASGWMNAPRIATGP